MLLILSLFAFTTFGYSCRRMHLSGGCPFPCSKRPDRNDCCCQKWDFLDKTREALEAEVGTETEERSVADPYWAYSPPSKDCSGRSFSANCRGCRGYLDSCCSDANCSGKYKCKAGIWSYSCDGPHSEEAKQALEAEVAEERSVSDPYWAYSPPSKDCSGRSFSANCRGCRGYLDSCCSDANCSGKYKCKAGIWSYSCDGPHAEKAVGQAGAEANGRARRWSEKAVGASESCIDKNKGCERYVLRLKSNGWTCATYGDARKAAQLQSVCPFSCGVCPDSEGVQQAEERSVADPYWAYSPPSKDCSGRSFPANCPGCRGYLDSCCSDANCSGKYKCKAGIWSYSCDGPHSEEAQQALEAEVGRWRPATKDCSGRSFPKNCKGCRGYLDTCCSNKNCKGKYKCKEGLNDYKCDRSYYSEIAMQEESRHTNLLVNGLALVGLGSILYGAAQFYLGRKD